MSNEDQDQAFSEAAFKTILERAMELEQARTGGISEREVHLISKELGISHVSVERAIAELRAKSDVLVEPRRVARTTSWTIHVVTFGTGALAALLASGATGVFMSPYRDVVTVSLLVGLQAIGVIVAVLYRGPSKQERFQLANIAMWAGMFFGLMYLQDSVRVAFLVSAAKAAGLTALAGAATIYLRDLAKTVVAGRSGDGTGSVSSGQKLLSTLVRPIKAIRDWIHTFMHASRLLLVVRSGTSKSNYV